METFAEVKISYGLSSRQWIRWAPTNNFAADSFVWCFSQTGIVYCVWPRYDGILRLPGKRHLIWSKHSAVPTCKRRRCGSSIDPSDMRYSFMFGVPWRNTAPAYDPVCRRLLPVTTVWKLSTHGWWWKSDGASVMEDGSLSMPILIQKFRSFTRGNNLVKLLNGIELALAILI